MSLRHMLFGRMFLPDPSAMDLAAKDSTVQGADFICPQSFGRNMYSDKNVGSIIDTARENSGSDIATFKWLRSMGFNPGRPNEILAIRCTRFTKEGFPVRSVIGQWEVLYAMWLFEPDWYQKHQNMLVPIWPPSVGYLGTRGMMLAVKDIAEAHGLCTPLLVAHPEHIQRCFFIARKIFSKSIAIDSGNTYTGPEWFDENSVQSWTRSPNHWLFYELLTRIHHRLYGWM